MKNLLQAFNNKLSQISSLQDLDALQTEYLGRNGIINQELKNITGIAPEKRKEYGQGINELKLQITEEIERKRTELFATIHHHIDVTRPGTPYPQGSLHLVTYAVEEISRIFEKIGFIRMSYPEIEWEWFSFEALNMPGNHPARDDFETFFMAEAPHEKYGKMVLTPHTSSGQPREMMRMREALPAGRQSPIRMINIAKTYRPNWDASHVPMFHQFEGLCVDKRINITHLKGTIDYFAKSFFGEERETRLRPFHFQFTEPSFEVDITCGVCKGTGESQGKKCKVCKSGWLEIAGAGMVHPNVLKAGKINPNEYSGWAFAFGLERLMMMKEGITLNDMRIMYSGDVRFLEQF